MSGFPFGCVPVIVSDSGSQNGLLHIKDYTNEHMEYWKDITFLTEEKRIDANANRAKLLEYCCNTGATYIIYMQDDVVVCPDFMNRVDAFIDKYSDEVMWTFHAAYIEVVTTLKMKKDKWVYPYSKYYGSLCHILRNKDCLSYAQELKKQSSLGNEIGGDIILAHWLNEHYPKKHIAASCPCYVQHIGDDSILSHSHGTRRNQSFDIYFKEALDVCD